MQTWRLVFLPPGKRVITSRWIHKIKPGLNGSGNDTRPDLLLEALNNGKALTSMTPLLLLQNTIPSKLAISILAKTKGWSIQHLDVKTTFLNGKLKEDMYMHQPRRYVLPGREFLVCRLDCALYGLKQTPRRWYRKIDKFFRHHSM